MLAAMASAAMTSAGDESTINGDGLRSPLGTDARVPTPWDDRIEPGANDPRTWHDHAIDRGGLRAQTEPGETDPRTWHDHATGGDGLRGSTEKSYGFLRAIEVAIWYLDILLDALKHIHRRTRRDTSGRSPV